MIFGGAKHTRVQHKGQNPSDRETPQPCAKSILGMSIPTLVTGQEDPALEAGKHRRNVSCDDDVRINPYDFIKALIEQSHDGLGFNVPPDALRQRGSLHANMWIFLDPGEEILVGGRVEDVDLGSRTVSIEA
jgi:hypothetical protein